MAYQLADNGYHNITLIEKSGRIGGKTETIYRKNSQGILIPHEMGTAYMHHGYKNIFKLFDKFECGDYFKNDSRHLDSNFLFYFITFFYQLCLILQKKKKRIMGLLSSFGQKKT